MKNYKTLALSDASYLPAELAAAAALAVQDILVEASSLNTSRSYSSALRYWAAWHKVRYRDNLSFPVTEAIVIQFIVDHLLRQTKNGLKIELPDDLDRVLVESKVKATLGALKITTISHRVAVLSSLHELKKMDNPCEQPAVKHLLSRARKACVKRGERPDKKTAITIDLLKAMLATCDDSLEGIRDRALLYFGFASGGRRRSEIAAAELKDILKIDDNTYTFAMHFSKTQQSGPQAGDAIDKPLVGPAARALGEWLSASGISKGAVFRRLWNKKIGGALSPAAIGAIVTKRAALAGLQGDFGGHSLRSGFVTEAGRQGVSLGDVMAMSGHKSVPVVMGYFQSGNSINNPAAKLFDEK